MKELQQLITERCHQAGACQGEFKRLISAKDYPAFIRVLIDNREWYIAKDIYDAKLLAGFDPEVLLRGGLATQGSIPVDFAPVKIGGLIWLPFNEGASLENPHGDYMTWDEAILHRDGRRTPLIEEHKLLVDNSTYQWALYLNTFGMLFDEQLFIPASGLRYYNSGALYYVASDGCYWSASPCNDATYARYLYFYSTDVYPVSGNARSYGFPVRCVMEVK